MIKINPDNLSINALLIEAVQAIKETRQTLSNTMRLSEQQRKTILKLQKRVKDLEKTIIN